MAYPEDSLICSCHHRYTVEPHGNSYALYFGRCDHRHGYNLCRLDDFDNQGEHTRTIIQQALNRFFNK